MGEALDKVDEFENKCRWIIGQLEDAGRMICDMPSSCTSHGEINVAIEHVQAAIHNAFRMRPE